MSYDEEIAGLKGDIDHLRETVRELIKTMGKYVETANDIHRGTVEVLGVVVKRIVNAFVQIERGVGTAEEAKRMIRKISKSMKLVEEKIVKGFEVRE